MYDIEDEEDPDNSGAAPAEEPTQRGGPQPRAFGALAQVAPELSRDSAMAMARQMVDPRTKSRAWAAGMMSSPDLSRGYGAALKGYSDASAKESELVSKYASLIQQAALQRQKAMQQQELQWHQTINAQLGAALNDPNLSHAGVGQQLQGLAQQGIVPGQLAEQYMKSLPQDPGALRSALTQRALAQADPYRAVAKPTMHKLGEGQTLTSVGPDGVAKPVATGAPKRSEISRLFAELQALPPGAPPAQREALQAAIKKAATHPPQASMTVNTGKTLAETMAGEIAKSAADARDAAEGARSTYNTATQLLAQLNEKNLNFGQVSPEVGIMLRMGQYLNVNGKDVKETLANTAKALQSMAQLELDAAQQMKGQGALTDSERSILRRAAVGDQRMTVDELRALATTLARRSRKRIVNYNSQASRLTKIPEMSKLAPLLEVEVPEDFETVPPGAGPNVSPALRSAIEQAGAKIVPGGR